MFGCHACLVRCLRAVTRDFRSASHAYPVRVVRPKPLQLRPLIPKLSSRTYAALAHYESQHGNRRDDRRDRWKDSRSADVPEDITSFDSRNIAKELKYIASPMQMADYIRNLLRKGQFTKAYELLKVASKHMQCTVGWNFLIDFQMSRGRVNTALKIYNDMKKRAQFPDSYTYLTLLRGFAQNAQHQASVNEAVKLYHSMNAANSRVKPAIIHTNAVLNVAAQAGDMDALWSIAGQIPEAGPNAADYTTYTTVLNALKMQANVQRTADVSAEQHENRVAGFLTDGRRIWVEVVDRWRKGVLFVDESLVCAMGRLLLESGRQSDWDDVFSLVEQAMRIPRQMPSFGSQEESSITAGTENGEALLLTGTSSAESSDIVSSVNTSNVEAASTQRNNEFTAIELPPQTSSNKKSSYVKPSNNTLSMLLEASGRLNNKRASKAYWMLLTTPPFNVTPDADNFHLLLRQFRRSRSSDEALTILRTQMHNVSLARKTFRIAMSTCARDKNNPNIMSIASAIVDIMFDRLPYPDIQTLVRYMELAVYANDSKDVVSALARIGPQSKIPLKKLLLPEAGRDRDVPDEAFLLEHQEAANLLARAAVACCDRLLARNEVPLEEREGYQLQRNKLTSFASRRENLTRRDGAVKRVEASEEERDEERQGEGPQEGAEGYIRSRPSRGPNAYAVTKGGRTISRAEIVRELRPQKRRERRTREKEARARREEREEIASQ